MLAAQITPAAVQDPDEWWTERRLLARKLLDIGDVQTAYRIARDAALPEKEGGRVEQLFTAGWIAFRFLNDPAAGQTAFRALRAGRRTPGLALARPLLAGAHRGSARSECRSPQPL